MTRPVVALLFAQFAAYHIDRCEAVAARLGDRAEVLAVEVATTSATYGWEASGVVAGARKRTLFPGEAYEAVPRWRRFWRQFAALWRCRMVAIGIGYDQGDIIALSWALALCGVRVVLLSESKFDDAPRRIGIEALKALALLPYRAAVVGASRHMAYMRFLGFCRRKVLPGYDTVGLARVLAQGGGVAAPEGTPHGARPFLFVGRFVEKKNLAALLDGYAAYRALSAAPHRLVMVGAGPAEAGLRAQIAELGLDGHVDLPGFLGAGDVARLLAESLALVLVSQVEQWGLVVNEALAFRLPVIVSGAVGARDALVRNLVNGFVVEDAAGLALAMGALSEEAGWRRMVAAAGDRAALGDVARFADAIEMLFDGNPASAASVECFCQAIGWDEARFARGWSKRQA